MLQGDPRRVTYLTAGAGGMFCGSCMSDNAIARQLLKMGVDVQLVPLYTPITTDDEDVSVDCVFFGGINVYLQQKLPWLRFLPAGLDQILNHPQILRWATKKDVQADPELLGGMTVSMLKGHAGFQRKEVRRLVDWLKSAPPELVNFSNILIAGCAPSLRKEFDIPVIVTLQGDDIFLDYIGASYRRQAIQEIRRLLESIDGVIVHSRYYADLMQDMLGIPEEKLFIVPLGIDVFEDTEARNEDSADTRFRVGYLARLAPDKGLHLLVDAFIVLRNHRHDVDLHIAGWLGSEHTAYSEEQFSKLRDAGLGDSYRYHGAVNRDEKRLFLSRIDLLSVPTVYREPKGLFALEAMASGTPVLLPSHGALPELLAACPGGRLHPPGDACLLANEIDRMLSDPAELRRLGVVGRQTVRQSRDISQMAQRTLSVYRQVLARHRAKGHFHK